LLDALVGDWEAVAGLEHAQPFDEQTVDHRGGATLPIGVETRDELRDELGETRR
jgi:hypothetical protein